MKLIETINNTALAVAAVPEALHEARWMMHELAERDGMPARLQRLIEGAQKKDKRIAELESEVRKLTEANHGAASELSRARADAASIRLEVARLQSEVTRLSAPTVVEPAIPEPDPGTGFELCGKEDATDWTLRTESNGAVEWFDWSPIADDAPKFDSPLNHYAFRRPIAKPEPKWVACTAEEARANPGESEWRRTGEIWLTCAGTNMSQLNARRTYRSTAPLPLEIAVPKSVWDRAPREAQLSADLYGAAPVYRLMRRHLPYGFRLDAP